MYYLVENNEVVLSYNEIPEIFILNDGTQICGFHFLTDEERLNYGFYVGEGEMPTYDPRTQTISEPNYDIQLSKVVASWTVSDRGFTSDEIIRLVTIAIDKLIISKCKEKRYDSPDSFPRYINSNPISGTDTYDIEMRYKTESIAATNWISQVWAKAEIIMMNVQLGNRPMPTINEVLSELPVFNWNEI